MRRWQDNYVIFRVGKALSWSAWAGRAVRAGAPLQRSLLEQIGCNVTVVPHDDFLLPSLERSKSHDVIGGDCDWQRLRDTVLLPLKQDRPGRYRRYERGADALAEWHLVSLGGVVIVEGIYTLRVELAELYDFRIWLVCPREIRLASKEPRNVLDELAPGDGGFTSPYSWHLLPNSVTFPEVTIELCDGMPSMVEKDLDYWKTVGSYCPWGARIISRTSRFQVLLNSP